MGAASSGGSLLHELGTVSHSRAVGNGCGGPGSALSGTATFGWEEFPGHDIGRRIS
ncbi:unnamed protein product [Brassica oleracea]|uniref:(rape) hypothetical protein n=2 Tax=Brassica napus TaxID=3708 RepID=A0A816UGG1_BRANA|nr:unnamed protein product [Brassica napus]